MYGVPRCGDMTKPHVRVFTVATSLLYVVERLGIIAKQAALQFVDSLRTDIRTGSDAFCVRLLLSTTGDVKDVQLYHGIGVRDLHTGHVTESRVGCRVLFKNSFLDINDSIVAPSCLAGLCPMWDPGM